jgi:hypothetical protein
MMVEGASRQERPSAPRCLTLLKCLRPLSRHRIRQHTSAYVSIRQNTSEYASIPPLEALEEPEVSVSSRLTADVELLVPTTGGPGGESAPLVGSALKMSIGETWTQLLRQYCTFIPASVSVFVL